VKKSGRNREQTATKTIHNFMNEVHLWGHGPLKTSHQHKNALYSSTFHQIKNAEELNFLLSNKFFTISIVLENIQLVYATPVPTVQLPYIFFIDYLLDLSRADQEEYRAFEIMSNFEYVHLK
jgi:hypothetical protein